MALSTLFLLLAYLNVPSFSAQTILKCRNEEILQLYKPAKVQICTIIPGRTTISNVSVSMSHQFCKNTSFPCSTQPLVVQNFTRSVSIVFNNVSWCHSGTYALRIKLSDGSMFKRNLLIKVGDIPGLPLKEATPKTCIGVDFFCFQLQLPKRHLCSANFTNNYWFNYSSSCTNFVQHLPLLCDTTLLGVQETVMCKDQNLDVCKNYNLKNCWLHLQLYGQNKFGSSKIFHFSINPMTTAPLQSLIVKEIKIKPLSSSSLEISWSRPSCREFDYVYRLSYKSAESNMSFKDYGLADSDKERWRKANLKQLKPFTNYTVCLSSMRFIDDIDYRPGSCQSNQTLQAAPSKVPEITSTIRQNTGAGKWKCAIEWKGVERKFWNGIIEKTILEISDKTSDKLARSSVAVPIGQTKYEVKYLDVRKYYLVKLKVCTKGGCNSTEFKEISIKQKDEKKTVKYIILGVILLVFLSLLTVIIIWRRKRKRGLVKTTSTLTIPDIDLVLPTSDVIPICNEIQSDREPYLTLPAVRSGNVNEAFNTACPPELAYNVTSDDSNFGNPCWSEFADDIASSDCSGELDMTAGEPTYSFIPETDPLMPVRPNQW